MKVTLDWIRYNRGGRKTIPAGRRYSTVARFEEASSDWPDVAWSLVFENMEMIEEQHRMIATVRFLSLDAPQHLLHAGSRFELYEGRKCVAKGVVNG
ncbi:MAG: hypothetical protein PF692_14585 [Kiritimatiellae bacterium]|nr:hypothetical protein [Kiritimatiellia bacterium]